MFFHRFAIFHKSLSLVVNLVFVIIFFFQGLNFSVLELIKASVLVIFGHLLFHFSEFILESVSFILTHALDCLLVSENPGLFLILFFFVHHHLLFGGFVSQFHSFLLFVHFHDVAAPLAHLFVFLVLSYRFDVVFSGEPLILHFLHFLVLHYH